MQSMAFSGREPQSIEKSKKADSKGWAANLCDLSPAWLELRVRSAKVRD
jgi:hypothetical protein